MFHTVLIFLNQFKMDLKRFGNRSKMVKNVLEWLFYSHFKTILTCFKSIINRYSYFKHFKTFLTILDMFQNHFKSILNGFKKIKTI